MRFRKAIVREVPDTYHHCISYHNNHKLVNISKAREQHSSYIKTLEELGLDVIILPKENKYPDSCFVEDTAIIHNEKAFITRMGAESRRGEGITISDTLKEYMSIDYAKKPSTIEGGDVIHLDNKLICGLSKRTNIDGVDQASKFLNTSIVTIRDSNIIHLKSYMTYIDRNTIVSTSKYSKLPEIENFNIITVSEKEEYAANTLTINGTVLLSFNSFDLQNSLKKNDFESIVLDMSQFEYCEGALSCLSLLF